MHDEHEPDCGCTEYRDLSRRQFLTAAATGAAVASFPAWLPKVVLAESYASRDILVSIFLRGGADGLSVCVPFGDPAYYTSRTTIAIPPPGSSGTNKVTALDNFFGLPPAMLGLLPAYQAQDLLFMHAAGQTNNSRSHFDAQRFLEVGKDADPTLVTGWLGRHLASIPPLRSDAPLRALGLAQGLQKTLVGGPKTLPISNPASFSLGGTANTSAQRLAFLKADYAFEAEPVHASALDAANTVDLLKTLGFTNYHPDNSAIYPNTSFGQALRSVAVMIKADIGIEAAQVDLGGWDTHAQQDPIAGSMFNTMKNLADSLAAFYMDVFSNGGYPVTVVAMSEFGRNVKQNGTDGTDHGRAGVMLAMGKGIAGGRVYVNGWPGLAKANLELGQDLKVTLDTRDVLAEIVQNRLGNNNLSFVFPQWTPTFRGVTK